MTEQELDAIGRLAAWVRDFGHTKEPAFIADLSVVLDMAREAGRRRAESSEVIRRYIEGPTPDNRYTSVGGMLTAGLRRQVDELETENERWRRWYWDIFTTITGFTQEELGGVDLTADDHARLLKAIEKANVEDITDPSNRG